MKRFFFVCVLSMFVFSMGSCSLWRNGTITVTVTGAPPAWEARHIWANVWDNGGVFVGGTDPMWDSPISGGAGQTLARDVDGMGGEPLIANAGGPYSLLIYIDMNGNGLLESGDYVHDDFPTLIPLLVDGDQTIPLVEADFKAY